MPLPGSLAISSTGSGMSKTTMLSSSISQVVPAGPSTRKVSSASSWLGSERESNTPPWWSNSSSSSSPGAVASGRSCTSSMRIRNSPSRVMKQLRHSRPNQPGGRSMTWERLAGELVRSRATLLAGSPGAGTTSTRPVVW